MERNPNDNLSSQSGSSSTGAGPESGYESGGSGGYGGTSGLSNTGSQGYGAAGGDPSTIGSTTGSSSSSSSFGSGSSGGGSFGGSSDSFGSSADSVADKAKEGFSDAKDKAKQGLSSAKDRAVELKGTLADKLEAGANKLRSQQTGGSYAGATGSGSTSIGADSGQLGQITDKLASGMQGTADFLRNADMDQMKSSVEKQVRENPGRSLLIAAGIGYLLGKAFRK